MPDPVKFDLDRRLHGVDTARMPDLWAAAIDRAQQDDPWTSSLEPPGHRRLVAAVTALALAAAAIGVLVWTFTKTTKQSPAADWHEGYVGVVLRAPDSIPGISNTDLYAIDPITGGRIDLTNSPEAEYDPAWSPDGTKVAFLKTTLPAGGSSLQTTVDILDVASGDVHVLQRCTGDPCSIREMAWSPDDVHLAWVRYEGGNSSPMAVEVVDTNDGSVVPICDEARCDQALGYLAWSPDGTQLAFAKNESGFFGLGGPLPGAIWVAASNGSSVDRITEGRACLGSHDPCAYDSSPAWAPDGRSIAFVRQRKSWTDSRLVLAARDGTNLREVALCPGSGSGGCQTTGAPHWSTDGGSILVGAAGTDGNTILRVDAASGAASPVPIETGTDCAMPGEPFWSPDGRSIAFTGGSRRGLNLCEVAPGGGHASVVVADPAPEDHDAFGGYTWLPAPAGALGQPSVPATPVEQEIPLGQLPEGTLAFTSTNGSNGEDPDSNLWVLTAGNGEPRQVTTGSSYAAQPDITRDASRVVLEASPGGKAELWTVNPDGTGFRPLSDLPHASSPAWSPDGSRIAYVADRGAGHPEGLWVANADGADPRFVTPGQLFDPTWSPDGTAITYERPQDNGESHIETVDLATGATTPLLDLAGSQSSPSWSPDGSTLAFWWSTGVGGGLYLADADGSNVRAVPGTVSGGGSIGWSPDGRWLAFDLVTDTNGPQIAVVHTDGSDLHRVTDMPGFLPGSSIYAQTGDPSWGGATAS